MKEDETEKSFRAFHSDLLRDPETLHVMAKAEEKLREFRVANPELAKLFDRLRPMIEALKPLEKFFKPIIETQKVIQYYVETRLRLAKDINIFPKNGWYLSWSIVDQLIENEIGSDWNSELEGLILKIFYDEFQEIENRITSVFPHRDRHLKHIMKLHRDGDFLASIPLALAQADGMCKDKFYLNVKGIRIPVGFFASQMIRHDESIQLLTRGIETEENSIFTVLSNQLAFSNKERYPLLRGQPGNLSDLNRHAILHGESLEYDSPVNSAKAILLLDFIADLVLTHEVIIEEQKSKGT